jgi:hypothetical protein
MLKYFTKATSNQAHKTHTSTIKTNFELKSKIAYQLDENGGQVFDFCLPLG